jgi:hypothetical protein
MGRSVAGIDIACRVETGEHGKSAVRGLGTLGETFTLLIPAADGIASNCAVNVPAWAAMLVFCHEPPWLAVTQEGVPPPESVKLQAVSEPGIGVQWSFPPPNRQDSLPTRVRRGSLPSPPALATLNR